jgi:hypothetical protein
MKIWKKIIQALGTKYQLTGNWVSVFNAKEEYIIQMHTMNLEANQIPFKVFSQKDSMYNDFGFIHIYVQREDEERAKQLIEGNE